MAAGDWVTAAELRREVDAEVHTVLAALEEQGWRIRRSAHKATLYCPCGRDTIPVPGSAKNPGNAARRIATAAARCPDRHPDA